VELAVPHLLAQLEPSLVVLARVRVRVPALVLALVLLLLLLLVASVLVAMRTAPALVAWGAEMVVAPRLPRPWTRSPMAKI
jgi:hypothetical protein